VAVSRRHFLRLLLGAGCAAVGYPVFIERYLVLTNRYRIKVPNLPAPFRGLRIVQLTDLHYGLLQPLALIEAVVDRANAIERDIVVCTGDYVHQRDATTQIDAVWPVLARLRAPAGVFSVLGNHDHWADSARSRRWASRTGQDLEHRATSLVRGGQRLWFAGAGDLWEDHRDLDEVLSDIPSQDCRIVLAHNPDTADTAYTSRIDLMISGHTHGGQVRLPLIGAPVVPVANKTYTSGLKRSPRGAPVFISRGIGWAGYPVRLNCYPEIAVLELVPAYS
jgi:predicted MPP superfamily phosphohydrolase